MTHRINQALYWLILINLVVAVALLIAGDPKNAMIGFIGASAFALALLIGERP